MIQIVSTYKNIFSLDHICNYISESIMTELINRDPTSKSVINVNIFNNCIYITGNYASEVTLTNSYIRDIITQSLNLINYKKDSAEISAVG